MKNINKAWLIWFVAALFYAVEFVQRVAPGVIAKSLLTSFQMHAATLGFISSLYFYAYAVMQIPTGIILDRFGVRWPLTIASFLLLIGTLLFALIHVVWVLALARIIVGIGSAFAFVGCLQIARQWFPRKLFPVIVGLTNTLGVIGALFGEEPLSAFMQHVGWQNGLLVTAIFIALLTILLFLLVRNRYPLTLTKQKRHLWQIITMPQSWLIGIYAGLMVAPVIAFAELWAVDFLQSSYHFSLNTAAFINSLIFVGIAIGGPSNGWLAKYFNKRKTVMLLGNIIALILLVLIIFYHRIPVFILELEFFFLGFCLSSMLLTFPLSCAKHPDDVSATVIAVNNMLIMIIGALFQLAIGILIDRMANFELALLCLPAALVINLFILFFIKEANVSSL